MKVSKYAVVWSVALAVASIVVTPVKTFADDVTAVKGRSAEKNAKAVRDALAISGGGRGRTKGGYPGSGVMPPVGHHQK